MRRVALIHTVKPVLNTFETELQEVLGYQVKTHNILDDFLASDPAETGTFSIENRQRLFNDVKSAELTGAHVIVVTCSTMTPAVQQIRPFVSCPLLAVDDAMTRRAVTLGKRIFVLATASSTLGPTTDKLRYEADLAGREVVIDSTDLEPAYRAMKQGDAQTHDRLVRERAEQITDADVIVLAQASMAHLEADIQRICKIPVLSSPGLCMQEVKQLLAQLNDTETER